MKSYRKESSRMQLSHKYGNGAEPQLQEGNNTTHRSRLPHPAIISPKRRCNNATVGRDPQLQLGDCNWTPPPLGFLKLNFDRVEKGNPGVAGMGGVIRDSDGNVIQLYAGSMGNSTNNTTKFGALELGL
jgi:hypothetical protein